MPVQVSVIMPVYNNAEFVGDSITSILQQSFTNFDFIIIDDASNDTTAAIINSFRDSRIVYCRNDRNRGNYYSRNRGMQLAKGKYIAIMDADDIAEPDRLEKQFCYLEEHTNLLAVGTDCLFLATGKKKDAPCSLDKIRLALLSDNCIVHSSLLIRADILRQFNGYDEHYIYSSDYDLICKLALLGGIENLPEQLIKYRWHSDQISAVYRLEQKKFAEEVKQKYQLAFINQFRGIEQALVEDADITCPDMGRVIGYYTYSACVQNSEYEKYAELLLDEIIENIPIHLPVRLKDGLLGIGCGMIYLLRNHFVEGEENEMLSEIDAVLFWALIDLKDEMEVDWYGWLHYFYLRISYNNSLNRSIYGITFCQHAIYLMDCLLRGLQKGVKWEGELIEEVEKFHQMKLCPGKTAQILSFLTSIDNNLITFVIPIRVDSVERERNLDILLEQLSVIEHADIHILEGDRKSLYRLKKNYRNVKYSFVEDTNPVFYRTKYLNQLLTTALSSTVGVWDTDVMIPEKQIMDAIDAVRRGRAIMSFPYDGAFWALPPESSEAFVKEKSFEKLNEQIANQYLAHGAHSVGGAFIVNRKIYLQAGGENEYFYGWGPEDAERVKRMEILGFPIYRAKGSLFHLYHPQKGNSWYGSEELELQNRQEFLKVCSMTREELQRYIQTWEWLPPYK